jgi:hypothetical protein
MQHKGSATIAMTSTVGEAAKLTVEEESDGPTPSQRVSQPV